VNESGNLKADRVIKLPPQSNGNVSTLAGETELSFYSSIVSVCPPQSLYINLEFFFWLKMVGSDNVILHTLAGCSRDSVLALLEKYSPTDSHREPSVIQYC